MIIAILCVVVLLFGAYLIGNLIGKFWLYDLLDNVFIKISFGIMTFGALYAVFVLCYHIFDSINKFLTT